MKKMLLAATLVTFWGLTGCAITEQPEEPAVASADASAVKTRDQQLVTGSRIPGARSAMVSATNAADAQRQLRDNTSPYNHKD